MEDWNLGQYLMFENERTQPAIDLINRICLDNPRKIIVILNEYRKSMTKKIRSNYELRK